jgi:hypothetical protein
MRTCRFLAVCVGFLLACDGAAATIGARPTTHREMEAIVLAWSARLNAGDNAGVARLFALPATIIQRPYLFRLKTGAQVAAWYAGLPCSGQVVSVTFRGRYATAVFKLGNRKSSKCDAPGALAAARFEIVRRKIVSWEQVAVPAKQPSAAAAA